MVDGATYVGSVGTPPELIGVAPPPVTLAVLPEVPDDEGLDPAVLPDVAPLDASEAPAAPPFAAVDDCEPDAPLPAPEVLSAAAALAAASEDGYVKP